MSPAKKRKSKKKRFQIIVMSAIVVVLFVFSYILEKQGCGKKSEDMMILDESLSSTPTEKPDDGLTSIEHLRLDLEMQLISINSSVFQMQSL